MKHKKHNKAFWNKEYKTGKTQNLTISTKPSSDLVTFTKWVSAYCDKHGCASPLGRGNSMYDIGCGNGRNMIYLAKEFGMTGSGFDISAEAIASAQKHSVGLPLKYAVRTMDGAIDLPDSSVDLVLDMMASHFLDSAGRERLRTEIARVLKPGGWLFYKTFLLDGDRNAKRLLREYPAQEKGSYIHPKMGVQEHVSSSVEIKDAYEPLFTIHKLAKSHNHIKHGRAHKRRSVSVYLQKRDTK